MNEPEIRLGIRTRLSFQVALLGAVDPHLRRVATGWSLSSREIHGLMFYDGALTDHELDVASTVEGELMADFPDFVVQVAAVRADSPQDIRPHGLDAWVYSRREET